jgi:cell division protease FtsH
MVQEEKVSLGRQLLSTIGITITDRPSIRPAGNSTGSDGAEPIKVDINPWRLLAFGSGLYLGRVGLQHMLTNESISAGSNEPANHISRYLLPQDVPYSSLWAFLAQSQVQSVQFMKNTVFFATKDGQNYITTLVPGSQGALFDAIRQSGVETVENLACEITFGEALAVSGLVVAGLALLLYTNPWIFGDDDDSKDGGKRPVRQFKPSQKKTTFADVAGSDQVKNELRQVVEFLHHPMSFDALGATPPKGFLLEGPSGTGKTLLARAVAGEADVPFLYESGSSFVEVYVGTGALRVRKLFENARRMAPCVVFIDEFDAIACMRTSHSHNQEYVQTLNQMLIELDGLESGDGHETKPVVVLAATNRSDMIDPAALRSGRFDRIVHIPRPDANTRFQVLQIHAKKLKMDDAAKNHLHQLAHVSDGLTGADLECVLKTAACSASRQGHQSVGKKVIDEALLQFVTSRQKRGDANSVSNSTKENVHNQTGGEFLAGFLSQMAREMSKQGNGEPDPSTSSQAGPLGVD